MPSSTGQGRIVFSDFSGGDYGTADPSKVGVNQFKGENVLVTADGYIAPRPGWRDVTPTNMPVGKVLALAITQTTDRELLFIVGDKVYTSPRGGTATEIGTLDSVPTKAIYPKRGTAQFYITVPGDKCYKLDPVSNTIDPLDDSPGGTELEIYGQRLVVVDDDVAYRIKFSDPADFDTWPAENFIDIGDNWQVTSLREQNNHLSIMKSRGSYVLTGVPGTSTANVRKTKRGYGPLHPGQADLDEDDMLQFLPLGRKNPATFDGINVQQNTAMRVLGPERDGDSPEVPLVLGVTETTGDNATSTVIVAQGGGVNRMLLNHNNAWTIHHVETDITGMVRGGYTGDVYITDGGAVGVSGKIYSNQFDINRPAFTTDGISQPGDASDTPIYAEYRSPQFWVPSGSGSTASTELQVRSVIVDFYKYNTGTSDTNHFDVEVHMVGRRAVGDASPVVYAYDEAGAAAGTSVGDIRRERFVHGFETAKAGGFELRLKNIRGVKIREITVIYDLSPTRPVS